MYGYIVANLKLKLLYFFSNYCLSENCKVNTCKRKYHNKILAKFASNEAFRVTILRSTSRKDTIAQTNRIR